MCPSPEISEPVKKKDPLYEEGGVEFKELRTGGSQFAEVSPGLSRRAQV